MKYSRIHFFPKSTLNPGSGLALLALLLLKFQPGSARAATLVWTNTAGGNWTNAANWSPNQVPTGADAAFITNSGAYTVSVNANAQTAALTLGGSGGTPTIQQTAGTFTLGSPSRILAGGGFTWSVGTLSGALTVETNGSFTVSGASEKSLNAAVTNRGTMQLSGSGNLHVYANNGARIENFGNFDMQADQDLYGQGGTPVLRNAGLLRKSAGSGNSRVGVTGSWPINFQNSGTVEAQSGALQFFGGGLLDGTFHTTAAGARNEFVGGTFTHSGSGTPVISGSGSTRLTGGTMQLHNASPNFQFIGGTVVLLPDFQGAGAITNLTLEGSTLNGTNLVTGTLRWRAGTFSGALTVASNGLFIIEGASDKNLNAAVTNRGTMQLSGSGNFHAYANNGARLENLGTFDFLGDQDIYGQGGTPVLRNLGLLRKTAGTGNARVGISGSWPINLQNSGTVEAQTGALQFFGGGLLDGVFTSASGARNEFVGGTFTHSGSGTPIVAGSGSTRLTGGTMQLHNTATNFQFIGGTVVLLPDFQGAGGITNLTLEGSTLNGTNLVTGTLRWRAGTFSGALTVASNGLFIIEGASDKNLNAAVTNRGTMQLSGSGNFHVYASNGARLENLGTFDLLGDQDLYGQGGTPVLRNAGLLRKSAGTGNARVGISGSWPINLQNSGTVQSQSGTIQFYGGGLLDGTFTTTTAAARIEFTGGTFTHSGSGAPVVTGTGLTRFTGGTFQLHDAIPNLQFIGGTVVLLSDFQGTGVITNLTLEGATLNGTNLVTGVLRWRNGTLNGALTIATNGLFIIEGTADKNLNAAVTNRGTMQLSGSGNFHIYANNGARLENFGTFDLLGDQDIYGQGGTPILRNLGLLRKTAGTGNARMGIFGSWPINLQNSGTVEAQSGVIQFFGGGLLDGTFNTTVASARNEFVGGTFTHSGSGAPVVSGSGSTRLTGGTMQLHNASPNFQFIGGTVVLLPDFQGTGAITNLTLDGSTLNGTNLVNGTLRWRNGTFNGALTVATNGLFIIEGSAEKSLNAAVTNRGSMQLSGGGNFHIYANNGARIENLGTFDLHGDQDLYGQGGTPVLRNAGLLRKTVGNGNARVGISGSWPISLQNSGTVEAQTGVIQFFGGGLLDGVFTAASGARNDFTGGTYTHSGSGTPLVTGAGLTRFTGSAFQLHDTIPNLQFIGGTVVLLPDFQDAGAITNLTLDGSTLSGTNLVTGTLRWRAGTFNGALTVASNGLLIVEGSTDKNLNAAVTNRGTMQLSGGGNFHIYANNGARIENLGTFDLQGDQDLYGYGGSPVLRNLGLLRKTTGTGNARVGISGSWPISLQNSGTVEAQSGTLLFFGTYSLAGGVLRSGINSLSTYGRINFSGNVSLAGTLSAYLVGGYSPAVSNKFNLVNYGSFSGAFTGSNLPEGIAWRTDYAATVASITALGSCTPPPAGLLAWWPGDGNANDVIGSSHGTLQNGAAANQAGLIGQAFSLDGANDYVDIGPLSVLQNASAFSVMGWFRKTDEANTVSGYVGKWNTSPASDNSFLLYNGEGGSAHHPNFVMQFDNLTYGSVASGYRAPTNAWFHLAVTWRNSDGLMRFYTNGQLAATSTAGAGRMLNYSAGFTAKIGEWGVLRTEAYKFKGLIDDVVIAASAFTSNEIAAVYAAGAAGLCRATEPPFVLAHPQSRTNGPNSTATFSVVAAGSIPIFYQWRQGVTPLVNGGRISGAQSNVLTITGVQVGDAGAYSCIVSNLAGSTNSLAAQLVVDATPPVVSLLTTNPATASCTISWQTDEPATAEVHYGTTASYGFTNRYNGALRTQHTIFLTGLTPGALHHFRVRSADAVSNATFSADLTFTTQTAPDLQVAAVSVPSPAQIQSGAEITIRWVLTNSGLAEVNWNFYDRVTLVNSNTSETLLNNSYYYNPTGPGGTNIPPGGTLTREVKYRLPDGPRGAGPLGIIVNTDHVNSIIEHNGGGTGEANNTGFVTLASALPNYPDLQIANLQLLPPGPLSGTPLQVLWQSTNSGSGTATGQWWDRVLIVNTTRNVTLFNGTVAFDTAALGPLTNGTSRSRSLSFTLPDSTNAVGNLAVTVTADLYSSVFEYMPGRDAETNNNASANTTVTLAMYPDLRVVGLHVTPASPVSGDLLTVSWLVTNAGNAVVNGSFNDRALLRRAGQGGSLASKTFFYDATQPVNGSIAPGGTRARQVTLQLPDGTNGVGNMQIELTTDLNNQVLEIVSGGNAEANNIVTNSFTSTLAAYSDLVAGGIVNPASGLPGATITLRWNVTNIGIGPLADSWSEQVFWSDDAALGNDDLLATFAYTNTLAPGAFISRTQQVVVPTLESGNRWFIIRVDSAARIFELNESNNVTLGVSPLNVPVSTTLSLGGSTIGEGAVRNATLSRNGNTGSSATFTLTSFLTNRLVVPASVNIPAGQASTGFQIAALENALVDGNPLVGVTAAAAGYAPASNNVTVVDNDQPTLFLQISKTTLTEGAGTNAAIVYLTRNTPTNSPLVVPLAVSDSARVFVPDQVTINAGASSVAFDVSIGDNLAANLTVQASVSASVPGYQTFPAQFTLLDNDTPSLALSLSAPVLIENAPNPAGTLTITRSPVTANRARLALTSVNGTVATVPSIAIIETNQASVNVPITVFNNAIADGPRVVELRVYPTDDLLSTPLIASGQTIQFTVSDDDGPALAVQIAAGVISETGATTGTVRRNTTTSSNLVVNLASSLPGEATVPATVTISNGQTSATFPITGVADGQPDGNRSVSITANAVGFNPGGAALNVSDIDLPDLRPVAILATNAALTDSLVPLSFVVQNTGLALAEGSWVDRVYLANSPAGDGLQFVGQSTHFADVPLGGSYTSTAVAFMPGQAGTYNVLVVVDENTQFNDGNRANNRLFSTNTITVNPAYRATIVADLASTVAGTPIPLHGRAFRPSDNSSVPFARVIIRTHVKGVRRTFETFSDASGNINYVLRLLPSEAGLVLLSADHPGVKEDVTQDTVEVYGMRFAEYEVNPRIFPYLTHTGAMDVVNLGDLPLTGLSAVFEGLPEFVIPEIIVSNSLPASERIQLTYRLTATNVVSATLVARIKLTSAEGAVATVQTRINLQPLTTTLVSTPGLVQAGAVRGEQKPVEFMVANVGGIASGELTVIPPALPWVTLSSPSNLPSLGPGESTRITLLLTPAADAALTLFNAPLYIVGENARLEVPTRLRIMSSAIGDLRVEVQDDYTYYVEGAPRVTNATVRLTDPYTHEVVAEGLTYPSGSIVFSNLLEGPYQMRVTADKHSTFAGPAIIAAGQESSRVVFLTRQTVSYRWTVVPTEVEDRYQVVLEPVFEVDVPIPVVTLDTPRLPMIVRAGGEGHFDIRLSNHGLIAAERVTVTVPDDPDYELTPLTDVIDVLPAKSTITIPIRVRAKATAPRIAFGGPNGGGIVSAAGLPTCGKTITGCDSIPKMSVKWSWVCGQNRQWMGAQADLEFSCAPDDCWEKIQDRLKDLGENVLKGDVADLKDLKDYGKDAICELLAELAACLGITDQCALAAMQAACGIATRDLGTAVSGAAGLGANCICPNFDLPSYKPSGQSDFGAFDGEAYYSGPATFGKPAEQPVVIVESGGDCEPGLHPARPAKGGDVKAAAESVCARVRLRLEQEVALTRQAFLGALEIDNGNLTPLTDIQVILDIRDTAGSNVNHRFAVGGPELDGLSAVDGSGVIAPQSPGSARYTFIPTREAAPDGPSIYKFGGTLIYYTEGVRVELPLTPEPITVYPDPALHLDYFLQRDVYGDDPFTDEIEPSEPFALGLLVRNLGKGPARNMRITSAQPKIIENEKGLLIDFKLIGTMAGTNPITPSLTVKLGDINAGNAQVAGFFMTASLQGKFIEYNASFEHLDTLGDQRTSLIDSLTLHEMTRVVRDDRAGADAAMDFLANDVPDGDNFPDTIWFSNGAQSPVNPGVNPSIIGAVNANNLQVQLTATMPLGWSYLKIPDPGRFFRLHRVVRSDGKEMLVGTNVWTTDRSFPSTQAGAIRENLLHLLDHNSTGSYTLYYRIFDGIAPQIVSVGAGVANIQTTAVTNVDVVTSESIEFSSFNTNDLVLTRNGINLSTASLTITNIGTNVYRIGGLAPLTGADGNYQLTVIGSGLNDFGGNPVSNNGVLAWAKGVGAPVVAFITAPTPDPRNIAVSNLDITFTQPIDPVTFTLDDLQLTRDGGGNILDSTPTLTPLNATTFRLGGLQALTLADGVYALTAFGTGVSGTNGSTGIGSLSRPWTMLTTGPTITELEAVNPNPRNIVVQALELTFARAIDPASFDWRDLTLTRDGGANLISSDVQVTQLSNTVYRLSNFNWVQSTAGNYTLTVFGSGILDPAGNTGSGAESQSWSLVLGHPPEPKQLTISPDTGVSASDGVTSSNAVTLAGRLTMSNLTVRVYDDTVGADLGTATVVGTNFSKLLTFDSAGLHALRIYSVDGAQNVSSNVLFNVFLDVSSTGGSFVAVDPNPRTNAAPFVDVQFTEAVNSNSVTRSAFALRRNGGADLLTPAVTVARLNPSLFRLGNLTSLNGTPGDYTLTLNLSPIEDLAGNRGGGVITQAWTVVVSGPNSAPVLQAITNRTVAEGVLSRFMAIASDPDQPAQTLSFSLGTGAPPGAGIDAVSGAFTWRPNSLQGPAVYPISVIVRDNGQPSLSATQTFLVTVTDALPDVVVSVDNATVLSGQTSSVPIRLDSGVVITNLTFDLQTVPSRLGQLALQSPSVDVLGSTWQPLGGDRYRANLVLNPIPGGATNRTLVRLGFVADANPQSAFVDVKASNVIALRNNGTSVANTAGRTGRISLVGIQPLLQISGIVNRSVLLHGRIGVNYVIEGTDELGPDAEWLPVTSVVLSNVVQLVALPPGPGRVFYRALEAVETGTALPLSAGGGQIQLRLTGIPGQIYQLERRADVNSPWLFQRPILLSANIQTNQVAGLTTNELWRLRLWYSFPPQLSVSASSNGTLPVTIFGRPGITYRLEHSGNLGSNNWQVISNAAFTTPGRVLTLPTPGSAGYYRALEP